jgi:putative transposase
VQTAEGELQVEIPQVRAAAEPFVSALFPHSTKLLRSRPLEAMVVGAFVRGLSMRDVESLCEEAGPGKLSKSTASRICQELRERFEAFKRRDLYNIKLVALFLDAIFLNLRPKGPKEGVLAPGASPRRASGSWSASRSGCASRTRTGSASQGT